MSLNPLVSNNDVLTLSTERTRRYQASQGGDATGPMKVNEDRNWYLVTILLMRSDNMGKFAQSKRMTEFFDKLNQNSTTGTIKQNGAMVALCSDRSYFK